MPEFTLSTLNCYLCRVYGIPLSPSIAARFELIVEEVRRTNPDFLCLQEVWHRHLVASLQEKLPEYHFAHIDKASWLRPMGNGLVIAGRDPFESISIENLPGTLRLKEMPARRGALIARIAQVGGPIHLISTHLGMGPHLTRRRQHQALLEILPDDTLPCILCGDFNLTYHPQDRGAFSLFEQLQERGFKDCMREMHGTAADRMVTIDHRNNPLVARPEQIRIDYIWYRPGRSTALTCLNADTDFNQLRDNLYPSDHYGLTARFEITDRS